MLQGANELNLDAKGRLAIPSRYREGLREHSGGRLVVTVAGDQENCLWMYPADEWLPVARRVLGLPSLQREHRWHKRCFVGQAEEVEMDRNGRVLLPATLRKFAAITKQLYLLGQGNKFEIWQQTRWNAESAQWQQEAQGAQGGQGAALSPQMQQLTL